jgi:ABC-2 type transport system ATP-binding protein
VKTPIAINNLSKNYGRATAVSDLSLAIEAGSVCGLLGPNGAGKTTTFKCLLGLQRPSSGTIAIDGAPLSPASFRELGFVPERSALYEWMSVGEHLEMTRRAYTSYDAARAHELAALFKLASAKRVKHLSKGQHTALALVLAFAIRPRILVLDEPASGLDPVYQRVVLDLIIEAAAGGACVLFSSHQIGQVERAADRIAIVRGGRLVVSGDLDALKGNEKIVAATFEGGVPDTPELERDPHVRRIERSGRILRAYVSGEPERIATSIAAHGPRSLDVLDLSLEDIFLAAVSDGAPTGVH